MALLPKVVTRVGGLVLSLVSLGIAVSVSNSAQDLYSYTVFARIFVDGLIYSCGLWAAFCAILLATSLYDLVLQCRRTRSGGKGDSDDAADVLERPETRIELCCIVCCAHVLTKWLILLVVLACGVMAIASLTADSLQHYSELTRVSSLVTNLVIVLALAGIEFLVYPLHCFCDWHSMFRPSSAHDD